MSDLKELLEITYEYPVEGVSHFFLFYLYISFNVSFFFFS